MKKPVIRLGGLGLLASLTLTTCLLPSCGVSSAAKNHVHADFDVGESLGITFPEVHMDFPTSENSQLSGGKESENFIGTSLTTDMVVVDSLSLYASTTSPLPSASLKAGDEFRLTETEGSEWAAVTDKSGVMLGYAKDALYHALPAGTVAYAELPYEEGTAPDGNGKRVNAKSQLVDVRKYLRCYESTNPDNTGVDFSQYDVKISMQLSVSSARVGGGAGEPFYERNLCLLQYDTLQLLMKAIELFKKDGYTVVIYDAYRPTSVQQKWFDVVRIHKWVANPAQGMGGVHDRGTAIDMSLIDKNGNELIMPTPMHTFSEDAARTSENMTDEARQNMNYMTNIMVRAGFGIITSEWWHFQDKNTSKYLPTDHPIDEIPLVPSEPAIGK